MVNNHLDSEIYFFRPTGQKYVGEWKNGKQHGKGKFYADDGQMKEGEWKNGINSKWYD